MIAGERIFVIGQGGGHAFSYAELLERVRTDRALSPVCATMDVDELAVELVKALYHGRPLTLLDSQLTADERSHLRITEAEFGRCEPLPACDCGDVAELIDRCSRSNGFELRLFTSGSTGHPTQIVHRLPALTRTLRRSAAHTDDVWALCYNPAHLAGVQVLLQALFNGNSIVDVYRRPPSEAWRRIVQAQVTHISATPTFCRFLLAEADATLASVRHVTLGGEPVDAALLRALREVFPGAKLSNHYALTECGTLLVSHDDAFSIPDSLRNRVRVQDGTIRVHRSLVVGIGESGGTESGRQKAESRRLKADSGEPTVRTGETVKGSSRDTGRREDGETGRRDSGAMGPGKTGKAESGKQETETQQPIGTGARGLDLEISGFGVSAFDAEWYDTGDRIEIVTPEPLTFRLAGRCREWINVGGEKVNPREVEVVLRSHPNVIDACVSGRRNSAVGYILTAKVTLRAAVDEAELRTFLSERLSGPKIPRVFGFVEGLPRTWSGKALRNPEG